MSTSGGVGNFVSWDGGCLLIGRAHGITPTHSHYAIQIAFGPVHGIRFRSDDDQEWSAYGGVIIASRETHSMDATVVPGNAVIFIEPETREGRALTERFLKNGGIVALPDDELAECVPDLFTAWRTEHSLHAIAAAGMSIVHRLSGGVAPSVVSDERILRAVRYIKANLHRPLTLDEVANEACLSPSRFRHLFVEETGMALRPYILWRRFVHVWELLTAGASLSGAAHSAGFADAAHLSRTSKTMFGFPPSALQVNTPLGAREPTRGS